MVGNRSESISLFPRRAARRRTARVGTLVSLSGSLKVTLRAENRKLVPYNLHLRHQSRSRSVAPRINVHIWTFMSHLYPRNFGHAITRASTDRTSRRRGWQSSQRGLRYRDSDYPGSLPLSARILKGRGIMRFTSARVKLTWQAALSRARARVGTRDGSPMQKYL